MARTKNKPAETSQVTEQPETAVNLAEEIRRLFTGGPFVPASYIEKISVMTRPELEAELVELEKSQLATMDRLSRGNYPPRGHSRSHWGGGSDTTENEDIGISRYNSRMQGMVEVCLKKFKTPER